MDKTARLIAARASVNQAAQNSAFADEAVQNAKKRAAKARAAFIVAQRALLDLMEDLKPCLID